MSTARYMGIDLFSIIAVAMVGAAACATAPESDAIDDISESADNNADSDSESEIATSQDAVNVAGCSTNMFAFIKQGTNTLPLPNPPFLFKYNTEKGYYTPNTGVSRGYDLTDVCLPKVNELRKATNSNWPNYTKKAATNAPSKVGCGVEYEAKLTLGSNNGHAQVMDGEQGSMGCDMVKQGEDHSASWRALDTTECIQKWLAKMYQEKDPQGNVGGHALALRKATARKIQCGAWQTYDSSLGTNKLKMVIDYWDN